MTSLNDLFRELNEVKVENKKAHKKKVEKYNLIESPNQLDVKNEINDIFSQLTSLKEQMIEHQAKKEEQNKKEEVILSKLEKVFQAEPEEIVEEVDPSPPEIEEEIVEEEPEEIVEEKVVEPIEKYTEFISNEDNDKRKEIKEVNEYDNLQKELELLKKRISTLATQVATSSPPRFPEGNSGGELNLVKPVRVDTATYHIRGTGGEDVFLCYTNDSNINIYLPQASMNTGFKVHIKKMHDNNFLFIRGFDSTQLVDEKEVITVATVYLNYIIVCDGSHWYIV